MRREPEWEASVVRPLLVRRNVRREGSGEGNLLPPQEPTVSVLSSPRISIRGTTNEASCEDQQPHNAVRRIRHLAVRFIGGSLRPQQQDDCERLVRMTQSPPPGGSHLPHRDQLNIDPATDHIVTCASCGFETIWKHLGEPLCIKCGAMLAITEATSSLRIGRHMERVSQSGDNEWTDYR